MDGKPPLILGTAEFGTEPYGEGATEVLSDFEIHRILSLAWEAGIRILDTAEAYHTEGVDYLFSGFHRFEKGKSLGRATFEIDYFYHYGVEEPNKGVKFASIYRPEQLEGLKRVIVPMNLNNTTFIHGCSLANEVYARSVFDRGRLFKDGWTVKDCLDFVKRQRVNGIIVGVNSVKELEEILRVY